MSKHTPGPWTIKNDYDERHIVIANIDGESFPDGTTSYTYDFVCDTYGGDYESASREVPNANARLIAAAPDMAKAGQALLDALHRYGFPVSDAAVRALVDGGSMEAQAVHVAAVKFRAALAKAGAP